MLSTVIAAGHVARPSLVGAGGSVTAEPHCAGGIFADTSRRGAIDPPPSPLIRRMRRVEVDFARVFPGSDRRSASEGARELVLNLFPDVCLVATREEAVDASSGAVRWTGRVTARGVVTLVIHGELMVGRVMHDGRVFEIRSLGDGVHLVIEADPSAFPRD